MVTDTFSKFLGMEYPTAYAGIIASTLFTPAGTVGWVVREAFNNSVMAFLAKSVIVVIVFAIVSGFVLVEIIRYIPATVDINRRFFIGLESLIVSVSIAYISLYFITHIGSMPEKIKNPSLALISIHYAFILFSVLYFTFTEKFRRIISN